MGGVAAIQTATSTIASLNVVNLQVQCKQNVRGNKLYVTTSLYIKTSYRKKPSVQLYFCTVKTQIKDALFGHVFLTFFCSTCKRSLTIKGTFFF